MATPSWNVNGQYYETCSCDFVCPCLPGQMAVEPSKGSCTFAMAFQIERGHYGTATLDGLGFIVLGFTPGAMGKGNWLVGLVTDVARAPTSATRSSPLPAAPPGGPMAAVPGLVGTFLGVPESGAIGFTRSGVSWSVTAPPFVDMAASGAMGLNPRPEPLNSTTPATRPPTASRWRERRRATSTRSALKWDDLSGTNNGQYAPFSWQGA